MDTNAKQRSWKSTLTRTAVVLVLLWLIGCTYLYNVMRRPPEAFGHFMMRIPAPVAFLVFPFETLWMHARSGALNVGDRAPDFTLEKLDKSSQVQLSSLEAQKQPVVLIFGSYT